MGVNSLPKTVTRQHRGCDLNPGLTAPEPSTLTTWLPSHPSVRSINCRLGDVHEAFQQRVAGLLLWSQQVGDIDRLLYGWRRTAQGHRAHERVWFKTAVLM